MLTRDFISHFAISALTCSREQTKDWMSFLSTIVGIVVWIGNLQNLFKWCSVHIWDSNLRSTLYNSSWVLIRLPSAFQLESTSLFSKQWLNFYLRTKSSMIWKLFYATKAGQREIFNFATNNFHSDVIEIVGKIKNKLTNVHYFLIRVKYIWSWKICNPIPWSFPQFGLNSLAQIEFYDFTCDQFVHSEVENWWKYFQVLWSWQSSFLPVQNIFNIKYYVWFALDTWRNINIFYIHFSTNFLVERYA